MKRTGFMPFVGVLAAFAAFVIMIFGTALCGRLITVATYVEAEEIQTTQLPETTKSPETTVLPETTVTAVNFM